MRLNDRHARTICVLVAALVMLVAAGEASAARPGGKWRSTRYGRQGAEMWIEIPRYVQASGAAFVDERNIGSDMGFGFGMMWGISDNLAFEGRMLQSNHKVGEEEKEWDLDMLHIGPRYTFLPDRRLQPFVGLGWTKLTIERDAGSDSSDEFRRLNGYAGYVTVGLDYIHSSAWSVFFRADYTGGGFGHQSRGLKEESIDPPLGAECVSVTIGLAYRIPAW